MNASRSGSPLRVVGWILKTLVALLLLLVALGLSLPFLIDPNDYRERIAQEIGQRTGFDVRIEGDLRWSLWPELSITVHTVVLPQPAAFRELTEAPLAQVGELDLAVELIPLLRRELRVTRVAASDVALELIRDQDGHGNWEAGARARSLVEPPVDVSASGAATGARASGFGGSAAPVAADEARENRGLSDFSLGALEIENARITFRDLRSGTTHIVDDLRLTTAAVRFQEPFRVTAGARVPLDGSTMAAAVTLDFEGRIRIDPGSGQMALGGGVLHVVPQGPAALAWDLRIAADAQVDPAAGTFVVPDLNARLAVADEALRLTLASEGHWASDEGVAAHGRLSIDAFSPRGMAAVVTRAAETSGPAEPAAVSLPEKASLTSDFTLSRSTLRLDPVEAQIDTSSIRGFLEAVSDEIPEVRFDLHADRVDLDDYVGTRTDSTDAEAPDDARPASEAPESPDAPEWVGKLDGFIVDGRLRIDRFSAQGLRLDDVVLPVTLADARLRAEPVTARLYSGTLDLSLNGAFREPEPQFGLRAAIRDVELGGLLDDLMERGPVTGIANIDANLAARGLASDAVLRSVSGDLGFQVADGAVRGINIPYQIRRAQAALRNEPPPPDEPAQTDFSSLQGTAVVRDGVVENQDLLAASPLLRVTGHGRFDLPAETIDYRARVRIVGSLEGQGGASIEQLRGVDIPLRITGPFDAPRFALDLDNALRDSLRERAEDRIRRELERRLGGASNVDPEAERSKENGPEQRLEDELRRGLQNLFGR